MDEFDLVKRCRRAEPEACRRLVARFQQPLFGYLWARTRQRATTEDLLQEVFLKIWQGLPGYRPQGRLDAWVFRIAERVVIDWQRRQHSVAVIETLPHDWISDAANVDDVAADSELHERVRQALDALPDPYRRALVLRFYSGLSFQQMADVLGCPLGTALSWVKRGLERLKPVLERQSIHE